MKESDGQLSASLELLWPSLSAAGDEHPLSIPLPLKPVALILTVVTRYPHPIAMLFASLELSHILTPIIVLDMSCSLHFVLEEESFVFELILHLQNPISIEFFVFKCAIVNLAALLGYPLAQSEFIIGKLALIFNAIGQLKRAMTVCLATLEDAFVVVSVRPGHPSEALSNTKYQISLIYPAWFILDSTLSRKKADALRNFQTMRLVSRIDFEVK